MSKIEAMTLTDGELFISDLGEEKSALLDGKPGRLGRYAVIKNFAAGNQLRVLEVGSNLEYLLAKYGITQNEVGRIAL